MTISRWFSTALAVALLVNGTVFADTAKKPAKEESSFGALKGADPIEVQKQAEAWAKSVKADNAKFKAIWAADSTLIEKVAATISLGDAGAAKLLADARNSESPAPTKVPELITDKKRPAFFRTGLALAYGKALVSRKVYEEALESLLTIKPEEAVDPSAYFFHKAVCEHALMLKDNADTSIDRLLVDVTDSPERYRMVAALMHFDMLTWQEKDLGWIARKMDNVQRRLDLKRGGKKTQKMQKEVLVRLEEMIKEIENKQKQPPPPPGGGGNGGDCPEGGMPGSQDGMGKDTSSSPANDTITSTANGSGNVDTKKAKELAEVWGKLPEKERAAALRELTRTMPPKDKAVIEAYFREIQKKSK